MLNEAGETVLPFPPDQDCEENPPFVEDPVRNLQLLVIRNITLANSPGDRDFGHDSRLQVVLAKRIATIRRLHTQLLSFAP